MSLVAPLATPASVHPLSIHRTISFMQWRHLGVVCEMAMDWKCHGHFNRGWRIAGTTKVRSTVGGNLVTNVIHHLLRRRCIN